MNVCGWVRECVRACVGACVGACVRACVRACVCVCVGVLVWVGVLWGRVGDVNMKIDFLCTVVLLFDFVCPVQCIYIHFCVKRFQLSRCRSIIITEGTDKQQQTNARKVVYTRSGG